MAGAHHPLPAAMAAMPVTSAAPAMMPAQQAAAMMPPQAQLQAPPQPLRATPAKRGREDDEPYMMEGNGGGGAGSLRSGQPWTSEENSRLMDLVNTHHERQWKQIAAGLPGRNESQCWHHWRYVLNPDIDRGSWTPEEDQQLISLVQQHGRKWSVIGRSMPQRTPKRIRERYLDQLDPDLSKLPWSPDEDRILSEKHAQLGSRWAAIAKSLPGRGGHSVKLRWLSRQRGAADAEMGGSSRGGGGSASGSGVGALVGAAAAASSIQIHDDGGAAGSDGEGLDADGNKKGKGKAKAKPGEARAQPQWSPEESSRLRELVEAKGARNWAALSRQMPGRTDLQCMLHWQHVLNPQLVKGRGTWSAEDDEQLRRLVDEHGRKWSRVAQHMPGRVGKQCRERYLNHLDPSLKREPWAPDEERVLDDACRRMGKKWAEIARLLPGRSENDVKNAWHSLLRRRSGGGSNSAVGASRPLSYGSGRRTAASHAPAAASAAAAAAAAAAPQPAAAPAMAGPPLSSIAHHMVPGATPGLAGMPLPPGAAILPPAGSGGAGSGGSIPMLPGGGMPFSGLLPPAALMPATPISGGSSNMSPATAMSAIAAAAAAIGDVGPLASRKPKTEPGSIVGASSSGDGGVDSGRAAGSSSALPAPTAAPAISGLPGGVISSGISTANFAPPPMPIGFAPPLPGGIGGVRLEQPGQGHEGSQPLPHVQAAMMAAAAAIANGMSSGNIPPSG